MLGLRTHLLAHGAWVGIPEFIRDGEATAALVTTDAMAVDARGLVHGGFIFGLADYASMLAVNDPNVLLGAADVRFLKPVVVGQRIVAHATVDTIDGGQQMVFTTAHAGGVMVFSGTFTCFVLEEHVLHKQ